MQTAFIWLNSVQSREVSGGFSLGISEFFRHLLFGDTVDIELFHAIIRKTAHYVEFFLLGFLYEILKKRLDGRLFGTLFFFPLFASLFTAVCDEFIQFLTDRGTAVTDVLLDFSGALCGILFAVLILYLISKHKAKNH